MAPTLCVGIVGGLSLLDMWQTMNYYNIGPPGANLHCNSYRQNGSDMSPNKQIGFIIKDAKLV